MADANLTTETWRPIPGFEGLYEVSDLGRVRSLVNSHRMPRHVPLVMRQETERHGYRRVMLRSSATRRHHLVHRLVALAFFGPASDGAVCNHMDGVKSNNIPSNLEWTTSKGNAAHAVATGLYPSGERHGSRTKREARPRGSAHAHSKLTEASVRDIRARHAGGASASALAREYGVSIPVVAGVIHRTGWKHVE